MSQAHLVDLTDEELIENAATASQHRALLDDPVVREAIILSIIKPFRDMIAEKDAYIDRTYYGGR